MYGSTRDFLCLSNKKNQLMHFPFQNRHIFFYLFKYTKRQWQHRLHYTDDEIVASSQVPSSQSKRKSVKKKKQKSLAPIHSELFEETPGKVPQPEEPIVSPHKSPPASIRKSPKPTSMVQVWPCSILLAWFSFAVGWPFARIKNWYPTFFAFFL